VLSRFSLQKFSKLLLKNLPQCVVKFNHETFLGCFLTFPVFSVLTTCFWSLAHLVGLSNALDHSVGRHFLNLRSAWLSLRFFHHILDSGSPLLISGLSSNFSVREKLPQCGTIKSMARPMDKSKVFFTFSPIRVFFLSQKPFSHGYSEFLIPGLRHYHRFGRLCKRCPFAWMM
jgi:hypothetical protein